MFPGGRRLQNPPPGSGPPQPVPFPSQLYYGAQPGVSNPTWFQNPVAQVPPPVQHPQQKQQQQYPPANAGGSRDILADSYERMRNEMRSLQGHQGRPQASRTEVSQPAAPPPPSMDATKDKFDPLTQLLDNKEVSLSSLLEAAMVPTVGSNNRTEDPIMKKTILDKCEGKIAQLYRHRISGQGMFFPLQQPKSEKINGSSLLAFHHPRLEFNMLPLKPIWMSPEVSLEVKEEKEEKVKKEDVKSEPISVVDKTVKRSKSPAALRMRSVNVEDNTVVFNACIPPPAFKPSTPSPPGFGAPPAPVPAPMISVPDPYATTAIDIWAEMEKERRRKETEKQWEELLTAGKRKKKKKKRSRSRSSSSSSSSAVSKGRSRSRRSRSHSRGSTRSRSRRSRSRRSHRRSRSRSRKRHASRSKRRRRRSSSSLSLSPPRKRSNSPRKLKYARPVRRSPSPVVRHVSPTRVHGMVGEWPSTGPPSDNLWPRVEPPLDYRPYDQGPPPFYGYPEYPPPEQPDFPPYGPMMGPPFPMGHYGPVVGPMGPYGPRGPYVDGPRQFPPMPPQSNVFGPKRQTKQQLKKKSTLPEVIVIDDDKPVEKPPVLPRSKIAESLLTLPPGVGEDPAADIFPPGEQPLDTKPKYPGVESEYTKPLRVEFRKLLAPIHNVLDYIRHYQRDVASCRIVIKNLEAGICEFEGLYTLVDGLLCKLDVERGKSKFFKVVLPEVRRYRIIKEIHRVYHDYSIHRLQDIIADVFPQEERHILNKFLVTVFKDCRECDAKDFERRAVKAEKLAMKGEGGDERRRRKSKDGKLGSSERGESEGEGEDGRKDLKKESKNVEEALQGGISGSKEEGGDKKKKEIGSDEERRQRRKQREGRPQSSDRHRISDRRPSSDRHHSTDRHRRESDDDKRLRPRKEKDRRESHEDAKSNRDRSSDPQEIVDNDDLRAKLKAKRILRERQQRGKGKKNDEAKTDGREMIEKEEQVGKVRKLQQVKESVESSDGQKEKPEVPSRKQEMKSSPVESESVEKDDKQNESGPPKVGAQPDCSATGAQPTQNDKKPEPPKTSGSEDFKARVRRVQLNVHDFKAHIEALESSKKTTDAALVLKAGMLCRRFPSPSGDGKAEVKIVVDGATLTEMVAIVHTMASVHAPLLKTVTVFNKHFVPIDGLEAAVKSVLDQCDKCKKP